MKEELIKKMLKGQATPEEEHLIAQMLREKHQVDTDLWLVEDETETYDRIVAERQSRQHRQVRWAIAAVLAVLMAAGAIVLWPHDEPSAGSNKIIAAHKTKAEPADRQLPVAVQQPATVQEHVAPVASAPAMAQKYNATPTKTKAKATSKTTNTTDSLQYYITRLEQELAQVTDSSYTAKAEQIIRADARLQRLVQRIMMGEITRNDQPVEAMTSEGGKEDLP